MTVVDEQIEVFVVLERGTGALHVKCVRLQVVVGRNVNLGVFWVPLYGPV